MLLQLISDWSPMSSRVWIPEYTYFMQFNICLLSCWLMTRRSTRHPRLSKTRPWFQINATFTRAYNSLSQTWMALLTISKYQIQHLVRVGVSTRVSSQVKLMNTSLYWNKWCCRLWIIHLSNAIFHLSAIYALLQLLCLKKNWQCLRF